MTGHDRKLREAVKAAERLNGAEVSPESAADRAESAAAVMFGWQRENGANAGASGFTVGDAPAETDDEAVARLAKLPVFEYERCRDAEAERLRLPRVAILDKLVDAARRVHGNGAEPGQGRKLEIARPEPWPASVNGAELLDAITGFFKRHVFLPAGAAEALAAWTVHTYCFARFRHSPRVAFTSPEKKCGKTTALDALGLVACAPLATTNVTAAALFRTIELAAPTLLIDEADTFLGDNEDLRGAINAGHKRGGQVIRCVGDDAEPRVFSVFAPTAIAAIGKLGRFGTIEDRSLVVRMQRALRAERPAPLDASAETEGRRLARMAARWAGDHAAKLAVAEPALPAALFNRAADNWRPLFAIAELAGGAWPQRLATASDGLAPDDDDEGRGIRLLGDIHAIFAERAANRLPHHDRIATKELLRALLAIEASPWPEANNGKPLTEHRLAKLLRQYQVLPGTVRVGDGPRDTPKGYKSDDFRDAWRRYLPESPQAGGLKPPQRHNPPKTAISADIEPPQAENLVADCEVGKPQSPAACGVVAVSSPLPGETVEVEGEL